MGNQLNWNGEWYVNFGCVEGAASDPTRSWVEAVRYGFISGGGGRWYSDTLLALGDDVGARIWVNVPGSGYVGVGRVTGRREPLAQFKVSTGTGQRPALDELQLGRYIRDRIDDPDFCEYFVPVRWLDTVSIGSACREPGLAGYRHTACRPRTVDWDRTVTRLKQMFPHYDLP
jgi:hypothetical protein